jgi:succinate-semialdehyde dehydrogenase/glutarate-semialdehyde dehydrogenase
MNGSAIETSRDVESVNPLTGHVWCRFEPASPDAVAAAVHAAREAQRAWRQVSLNQRVAAVGRVRREIYRRRESLADILQREIGKPPFEALFETMVVADTAVWVARTAPRLLRVRRRQSRAIAFLRKSIEMHWEPYGVVGIIAPWNYPLLLVSGTMLPALAAGNAVVVKPSEMTPSSAEALVGAVRAAGIPHDLLQCVQGDGRVGQALIESGIDRLFFTGSEATGRKVAVACGERLIPCSVELGGSDPAIVLEDANPEHAAAGIVWGRYMNAGQSCVAPKRVFVLAPVYDRFVEALSRRVSALRVGTAADRDVGPLIRPRQARILAAQLDDARERGARPLASSGPVASAFAAPAQLLVEVDDSMCVMREETFGPLLPVMRVRSVEEAVAGANASRYGLGASVWTQDVARGRHIARLLDAGTVMINDVLAEAAMTDVAHGGTKSSGAGRLHGDTGLLEVVRSKTVVVDRFATWKQLWWFPYTSRLHDGMAAFFQFLHGEGVLARAAAGMRAVRLLYFRH